MNFRIVTNYLGKILMLESVCMVPSLLIAIFKDGMQSALAFGITMLLQIIAGLTVLLLLKPKNSNIYAGEGCLIVAFSWILISLFGALPFLLSGTVTSYVDAVFETVSGFTTTGATILNDIESAPMSILYWRAFTHWLGGMGVLVFVLAIAPLVKGNGMPLHILRAESPGPTVGKIAPKLSSTARILYNIYIAMTIVEFILLLFGGMSVFEALTTSFSSAGTGGFSIRNDSAASFSPYSQVVVGIFVFLFGVNFNIYYLILIGEFRSALKNSELRTYFLIVVASVAAITAGTLSFFGNLGEALRHSFFQVTSLITTTGFITCDYELWPEYTHSIVYILMIVGACAGSTGGGLKVSRLMILMKSLFAEIKKSLRPNSVSVMTMEGAAVDKDTVSRCGVYFFVYIFIMIVSTLLLSFEGHSFETNLSAVVACLNNVGPGFGVAGPTESFSGFSTASKLLLSFNMLVGRLELFPMLLLFYPATWRSKK